MDINYESMGIYNISGDVKSMYEKVFQDQEIIINGCSSSSDRSSKNRLQKMSTLQKLHNRNK